MLKETYTENIETERLLLRKFEYTDEDSMLRNWIADPEVQHNYGEPVYSTSEEVRAFMDKIMEGYSRPHYYKWAVIEKDSRECVGLIAYFLVDVKNEFAEIEYCIGTAFQGKGYATEACKAVIRYGFDVIGLHKVQICARPSNAPSRKVIEKCGFEYEGMLRDYFHMADGTFESRMYFSILNPQCSEQEKKGSLKNVVLDMGNVLLDFNPDFVLDAFCSSDEEKEVIRRELFDGPEWLMGDRGDIKDKDRFDLVKKRVPEKYHDALRKCADGWKICMNPLKGAREFCERVKANGYGIYVLSNASDLFYDYFPKFLPLDFFTGVFVSSDYLMLKPDVEIYKTFLNKYGLKGEECLFVDDREENVSGARKAGMQAFCFKGDYDEVLRLL